MSVMDVSDQLGAGTLCILAKETPVAIEEELGVYPEPVWTQKEYQ